MKIKNVREKYPEIKINDVYKNFKKNQEVSQINTSIRKKYGYTITALHVFFKLICFGERKEAHSYLCYHFQIY